MTQGPGFLRAVMAYARSNVQPWHTPGHKLGRGAPRWLQEALGEALTCDLSDVLHHPSSGHDWDYLLGQAEARAAELYGAAWTRFLVNGTSGGVHAMMMAYLSEGDVVVVPREAHLSVASGLILSGATPLYLPARYDENLGLCAPPGPAQYADALQRCPAIRAALVTYPNYYGLCPDLVGIAGVLRRYGAALLVDEAHGAHYPFHADLPPPALECGAQVTVQSTHKTLGALTQASMIHAAREADSAALERALVIVGTTSPSSLLLASLDAARAQMEEQGEALWGQALRLAAGMRSALSSLPGVQCLEGRNLEAVAHRWDPSRLIIRCSGRSGLELAEVLRRQFAIQVEMADLRYVVILVGLGDNAVHGRRLVAALRALSAYSGGAARPPHIDYPGIPPLRLSPRVASQARCERVAWARAVGRVAAQTICPYPPGVPVLVPGEEITSEVAGYAAQARALGFHLRGDRGDGCVAVVA